ncbi:hypothetical protein MNBD_NITROSPINAE02-829 [hydrothermal vent metagenome]|uniref:Transglutaminase-like domain-containing protein n=1 Tax=hydrothermal vent metagenome TaxID=652676 RepID=A0A3B1C7P5_9ZZZZ
MNKSFGRNLIFLIIFFITTTSAATISAEMAPEWLSRKYSETVSEEWMNVKFGGRKIGFSFSKTEKGKDGYLLTSRAVIRLEIMGQKQDLSFSRSFHLDSKKRPLGFISIMKMGTQRQQTFGVINDNILKLAITGVAGTVNTTQKLKKGIKFLDTLGFVLADRLAEGTRLTIPVYLVELRTSDFVKLEVKEKKTMEIDGNRVEVFVVDIMVQGFVSRAYVTREGVTLREEQTLLGMVSERTTEKDALSFAASGAVPVSSLITFSLIKPDRPVPNPTLLKELIITMGGVKRAESLPVDYRQTTDKPFWEKDAGGKRKLLIPMTIRKSTPAGGVEISYVSNKEKEHLKATPEIQSDNRLIKREAKKIIGGEKEAWKAAIKINRWVYSNVEKELVDSFTAIDVLHSKKGECQSHSNLFAAFARSVGIPTKIASGIVYSEVNQGFFYHAWPEVYVGQWVAMDPTLGQDVADVTHIKLSEGGVESQLKLIKFIGKISVSVDSYK